jgi:hypothetical protein
MNGSKTVTGELVKTFQGGHSEGFKKRSTMSKVFLLVGLGGCLFAYYLGTTDYSLSFLEPLALGTVALVVAIYYQIVQIHKVEAKVGEKVIEIHDDGVILYTSDGKAEFICAFKRLKEPTVKTFLGCYMLELIDKYNSKAFMYVKSMENGWEICETIRNTAIAAGKERKGE